VADTMPNDHRRAARQMNMPLRGGVPRRRGAASFNKAIEAIENPRSGSPS